MSGFKGSTRGFGWQIIEGCISAVLALAAIFVAYHIFFLQHEVRELKVIVLADTSLIEVESSIRQDIEMLYKGQAIDNLSLVQLKVENSGNQVLRKEDYEEPIKFIFPSEAKIVEANVLDSNPPNIEIKPEFNQNIATLPPTLLNDGDQLIIRVLLIDMPSSQGIKPFHIEARIAGVKKIQLLDNIERESSREMITPNWSTILALLFLFALIYPLIEYGVRTLLKA